MTHSSPSPTRVLDAAGLKGRVGWGVGRAAGYFYPRYTGEDALFAAAVERRLTSHQAVLDAGCGAGGFFTYPWRDRVRLLVGCDYGVSVARNPNLAAAARADLEHVPFADGSFDVVFMRYVAEHLARPEQTFAEIARVLKRGGALILLTPNKHHYIALVSRLTPHRLHERVSSIRGNAPEDAFPTCYRANTRSDLIRCAGAGGLTLVDFASREMRPNYLLWSLPAFLLGVAYERLVNRFDGFRSIRGSFIATFEK